MIQLLRWPALIFGLAFLFRSPLTQILCSLKALLDSVLIVEPALRVRLVEVTVWPVITLILIAIFSVPLVKFLWTGTEAEFWGIKIKRREEVKYPEIPTEKIEEVRERAIEKAREFPLTTRQKKKE